MIKIGICDDEPIVCEILKKKVSVCLAETNTEAEIECFYSGKELLDNSKKTDILFLDIEMPKLDGIETGKKLRENGKDCKIIVATSRVDRFKEGNLYSFYFAPRGSRRMTDLGIQLSQMYLSPFDHIIGIIGDAGAGKSLLIKGMFPGIDLTNDDEGVNIRPLLGGFSLFLL